METEQEIVEAKLGESFGFSREAAEWAIDDGATDLHFELVEIGGRGRLRINPDDLSNCLIYPSQKYAHSFVLPHGPFEVAQQFDVEGLHMGDGAMQPNVALELPNEMGARDLVVRIEGMETVVCSDNPEVQEETDGNITWMHLNWRDVAGDVDEEPGIAMIARTPEAIAGLRITISRTEQSD